MCARWHVLKMACDPQRRPEVSWWVAMFMNVQDWQDNIFPCDPHLDTLPSQTGAAIHNGGFRTGHEPAAVQEVVAHLIQTTSGLNLACDAYDPCIWLT